MVLIVRGVGLLVKTITAFTIAHSITLALAALGVVHVPSAPVEAVIALSIVFVAAEIIHRWRGRSGLTERSPWIVAFTFGLLHGFGFAGALSEVGLPPDDIPLALLLFNLGVEAASSRSSARCSPSSHCFLACVCRCRGGRHTPTLRHRQRRHVLGHQRVGAIW